MASWLWTNIHLASQKNTVYWKKQSPVIPKQFSLCQTTCSLVQQGPRVTHILKLWMPHCCDKSCSHPCGGGSHSGFPESWWIWPHPSPTALLQLQTDPDVQMTVNAKSCLTENIIKQKKRSSLWNNTLKIMENKMFQISVFGSLVKTVLFIIRFLFWSIVFSLLLFSNS